MRGNNTRLEAESVNSLEGCGPVHSSASRETKPLRQQVFEQIRASGHVSRATLARTLNVSPASVTTLTSDLIAEGFLREVEGIAREAGRGRPPVALQVVSEVMRVIGIKLSDERHTAAMTDFSGNVIAQEALETSAVKKSLKEVIYETNELVSKLVEKSGVRFSDVAAIGVGIGGLVDYRTGTSAWSPLMEEINVPLQTALEERFGIPCLIDNDANMLTLAELWFGAGRKRSDFAVVTVAHGVGMGMVLNSEIFRGIRSMGLELGHTKVQLDGALCRCGQRGCLETYVADYALAREASTALGMSRTNQQSLQVMLETLYKQAKSGNQSAQTIFKRAGRYLAVGLSNVINTFDPELIILSGERMQFDYLYAAEVLAETQSLTLGKGRAPCKIEIQTWDDMIWARGAAALALGELTNRAFGEVKQIA